MLPLLLTATVNPNGMQGACFSVPERAKMYAEAVSFYVEKGCQVVFAENSGEMDAVMQLLPEDVVHKVEWVNTACEQYDQSRGKGYNEVILLRECITKSDVIRQFGCFFKLTGRLKVLNIQAMINECTLRGTGKSLRFLADCKDHKVYEWLHMPINGHVGECRYWYASIDFFQTMLAPRIDELNDFGDHVFLAEDLMLDVCRKSRRMAGCFDRFRTQARISGKGGHNLGKGWSFFYSTDNDSVALKVKCGLRQVLRWIMPWWKV